jgi:hypothetical protein
MDTERVPPRSVHDAVAVPVVDDKNGRALRHCCGRKSPLENQ